MGQRLLPLELSLSNRKWIQQGLSINRTVALTKRRDVSNDLDIRVIAFLFSSRSLLQDVGDR